MLAEQFVDNPEAALHGTRPLWLRVLRQKDRHAEQTAATFFMQTSREFPVIAASLKRQAVMLSQSFIDERRVAAQQFGERQ